MYTSGFEGPWTTSPLQWDNQYFENLVSYNWEISESPGNKGQFKATNGPDMIMMLVSDVSLLKDKVYKAYVDEFARNKSSLEYEFERAWYFLASRDMGPASRCIGPFVPPPQSWQQPLPPPGDAANWDDVKTKILAAMRPASVPSSALAPDKDGSSLYYGAAFIKLAWQCAATFRRTDYRGGCNGARLRLQPQASWPANKGMGDVMAVLMPVKDAFPNLSWADLIVFASHVAIEDAASASGAPAPKPFCPGRTDAPEDEASDNSLQVFPRPPLFSFNKLTLPSQSSATLRLMWSFARRRICSVSPCAKWWRFMAALAARLLRGCKATTAAGPIPLRRLEISFL